MYDGHWFGFGGPFMWFFWLLLLVALVLVIKAVAGSRGGSTESGDSEGKTHHQSASEILKERYARGEIEREEYEQKRKDLSE